MSILYYVTCMYGYCLGLLYAVMLKNSYTLSLYKEGKQLFIARFIGIGVRLGVVFGLSALFAFFTGCDITLLGISMLGGYISYHLMRVIQLWM